MDFVGHIWGDKISDLGGVFCKQTIFLGMFEVCGRLKN